MSPGSARSRLVITGLGTVNALGHDTASFWTGLVDGARGLRPLSGFNDNGADVLVGEVTCSLDLGGDCESLSRTSRLAVAAAEEAIRQSGVAAVTDRSRVGVVIGTTTAGIREAEEYFSHRASGEPALRSQLLSAEKAITADLCARCFDARGPRFTLQTACASGASSIIVGAEIIERGLADSVLVGGSDGLARLVISGFRSLRALDPNGCRPFDRARRGLSIGEGAGMLVLERRSAAESRGAAILAELLGSAQTSDAYHLTAPQPEGSGAARAIRGALAKAGIPSTSVSHINAHGTGTPANDAAESAAIHAALGEVARNAPVTSIKGSIGHTLAAAGAIEAIATIMTLRTDLIPPTVGLTDLDTELDLDVVRDNPRRGNWDVSLSHSFGFGGVNAVLCLGRGEA